MHDSMYIKNIEATQLENFDYLNKNETTYIWIYQKLV